jgi:hypothetical protein
VTMFEQLKRDKNYIGMGVALGLCFGAALGLTAFDNIAIGIGAGLVLGLAIGTALQARHENANIWPYDD